MEEAVPSYFCASLRDCAGVLVAAGVRQCSGTGGGRCG